MIKLIKMQSNRILSAFCMHSCNGSVPCLSRYTLLETAAKSVNLPIAIFR